MNRWIAGGLAAASLMATMSAQAMPKYAAKEKKACTYCHVAADSTKLNAKGTYYKTHKLSLAGMPPAYISSWRVEAPTDARRAALVDADGKHSMRVATLGAGTTLTLHKIAEGKAASDGTIDLGPKASQFVAGSFAGSNAPGSIIVPGAVFVKKGDTYAKIPSPSVEAITGTVRFTDGAECAFFFDGAGQPAVWTVKPDATDGIGYGPSMVMPDQGAGTYSWLTAKLPAEALSALGWPADIAKAGIFGLVDARADNTLNAWAVIGEGLEAKIVVTDMAAIATGSVKPVWTSPKLAGSVLDVSYGLDPKDGKTWGFLVLTAGKDNAGRTLEFFALD